MQCRCAPFTCILALAFTRQASAPLSMVHRAAPAKAKSAMSADAQEQWPWQHSSLRAQPYASHVSATQESEAAKQHLQGARLSATPFAEILSIPFDVLWRRLETAGDQTNQLTGLFGMFCFEVCGR